MNSKQVFEALQNGARIKGSYSTDLRLIRNENDNGRKLSSITIKAVERAIREGAFAAKKSENEDRTFVIKCA